MIDEASLTRFVTLDEEGYFVMDGLRVSDQALGAEWLAKIQIDDRGRAFFKDKDAGGEYTVIVEAFDQPLVALDILIADEKSESWIARFPYGVEKEFVPETLCYDEWDRFHLRTKDGVAAVLGRSAQARFFQAATDYDDESVTFGDRTILLKPNFEETPAADSASWWSEIYRSGHIRWDLGAAHPLLDELLPPLKFTRSRVLVLGCGHGHDAAWWEKRGHIVTAVDFSEEAISKAKSLYGESGTLRWHVLDAFQLPTSWSSSFDIIFEHTMYCAVPPHRRAELAKVWWRLLSPRGRVLGIVPAMDKPVGPPYGGTEWELRRRLLEPPRKTKRSLFRPLIWKRLRNSQGRRFGRELFFVVERGDSATD